MGALDAQTEVTPPKVPGVSQSTCDAPSPNVGSAGCGPSPHLVSGEAQERDPQTPETPHQCVWKAGEGLQVPPSPTQPSSRKHPASLPFEGAHGLTGGAWGGVGGWEVVTTPDSGRCPSGWGRQGKGDQG